MTSRPCGTFKLVLDALGITDGRASAFALPAPKAPNLNPGCIETVCLIAVFTFCFSDGFAGTES
jgi:hypothetical protein